jgi:KipI family sensor histidine kinase inhibitor
MTAVSRERLADDALLLHVGPDTPPIDAATNARVHRVVARLRTDAPPWLRDLVPAYASLAVFFDVEVVDADAVGRWIDARLDAVPDASGADDAVACAVESARCIEIPVTYGGVFGEDLASSAAELGLSPETLIERHSAAIYTVAMIGFAPGFPYLLGLDPALALPRLATPRTRVPAGSVAIGGAQTGLYPRESPGGWRLIGRTPLRVFDPLRASPSLLSPGDRVRFVAIDADTFARRERET